MAAKEPTFFATAAEFRAWLRRHGASEPDLIVGFHKVASGLPSMTWPESVDEALCFGWIDGVRSRIDEHSYRIRFTPRRPTSTWSAINIARVEVLQIEGRMAPAGLLAFSRRSETRSRTYAYEQALHAELSPAQRAEFRKHREAWKFFQAQPASYRHKAAWHVTSAKREETRWARLARLIDASASGLRI